MEEVHLRQDTIDDITIDSLLYHYNVLKERAVEMQAYDKSEWIEAELIQLGRDLRSFEGVLEYYGVDEPLKTLILYKAEK